MIHAGQKTASNVESLGPNFIDPTLLGDIASRLTEMGIRLADEIEVISELMSGAVRPTNPLANVNQQTPSNAESPALVTEFLMSTLIEHKRLLSRGAISYHALYRWRAPVKPWQIKALRAMKSDPPAAFVQRVAAEMEAAARSLYGIGTFKVITCVPCGNSGDNCFAEQLAREIAIRLGVPVAQAFEPIAVKGTSHPKRNSRRPAMRLRETVDAPVLLIDDVATSGSHVTEAALLLQKSSPAVFPLVWIAN